MTHVDSVQQPYNPAGMQTAAEKYHLSQAMRVGNIIWVSGQVGVAADRSIPVGLEAQARLAFENLKAVLESAHATLDDVVELTLLFTRDMGNLDQFYAVKDEYIREPYPAITGFQVSALALPELILEVRAVAIAGSARSSK